MKTFCLVERVNRLRLNNPMQGSTYLEADSNAASKRISLPFAETEKLTLQPPGLLFIL
jgi:hypothetical protein